MMWIILILCMVATNRLVLVRGEKTESLASILQHSTDKRNEGPLYFIVPTGQQQQHSENPSFVRPLPEPVVKQTTRKQVDDKTNDGEYSKKNWLFRYARPIQLVPEMKNVVNKQDYTIRGMENTKATVPCISEKENLMQTQNPSITHIWKFNEFDLKDIGDIRYTENDAGDLTVSQLQTKDTGVFTCQISMSNGIGKNYTHNLIVFLPVGRKFVTFVTFVIDPKEGNVFEVLKNLLEIVCGHGDLCVATKVLNDKCYWIDQVEKCDYSIFYESVNDVPQEDCNEECVTKARISQLERANQILNQKLEHFQQDPFVVTKPDLSSIETRRLLTCPEGFYFVFETFKRCYPCGRGSYSAANSRSCTLCSVGMYQSQFGKHSCNACPVGKTTPSMGTAQVEDCIDEDKNTLDSVGILRREWPK